MKSLSLQMSFSLRFNVWLKWTDTRLIFQNLNEDHYQNVIPEYKATKLWKPMLEFKNSNEGQILTYHSSSSDMLVVRNGVGKVAPPSQWDEGRLFNSSETEILWRSAHLMKFKCHLDLYFFPFDYQTCHVKVRLVVVHSQAQKISNQKII